MKSLLVAITLLISGCNPAIARPAVLNPVYSPEPREFQFDDYLAAHPRHPSLGRWRWHGQELFLPDPPERHLSQQRWSIPALQPSPVPEPEPLALTLAGLGLIGLRLGVKRGGRRLWK